MYRVIIADDEIHVCLLLEKLVDWEKLGIQIIGMYFDGIETYEAVKKMKPEIVITDIMMPGMSGLEIIKNCLNDKIDTTFLLISGHAEFEYAHMAIAYGVSNYLLKPINGKDLENNLVAICEKLKEQKQQSENLEHLRHKIHISEEVLSKQFFKHYLENTDIISGKTIQEINAHYLIDLSEGFYRLLIIKPTCKVSFTEKQTSFLLQQLENYAVCEMQKYYRKVIAVYTDLEVYFLVNGQLSHNSVDVMKLIFSDISTTFYEYCYITMAVSDAVSSIKELNLDGAKKALMNRYNKGVNRILYYNQDAEGTETIDCKKYVNALSGYIAVFNIEGIDQFFQRLKSVYHSDNISIESLQETITTVKDEFESCVKKLDSQQEDIQKIDVDISYIVRSSDTKEELLTKVSDYITEILQKIKENENIDHNRIIQMAKQYIEEHLAEKITLEDIANIVYMNPTYFSTLFKKETGTNFSDYLTAQRIERAKEMLKSVNYSTQQVGEMVGYENARYFSKVFLKIVGITPSEFRKYSRFL